MPKSGCDIDLRTNLSHNSVILGRGKDCNHFSCLLPVFLFLPFIKEQLRLYWIEQGLWIDAVSPLRINVISALCDSQAGVGLAPRQVG